MLENMRRRMRGLVKLMPRIRRGVVYTDFEDELGELSMPDLRGIPPGANRSRFEAKVRTYLRSHEDELAVQKLRRNQQITTVDLNELESVFIESGYGTREDIDLVAAEHGGFGLFLRSVTGLDHEVAAAAFKEFLTGRNLTPPQRAYLDLLIDSLARNGVVSVGTLYESPFTLRAPRGPEDLFSDEAIDGIVAVLDAVRATARPTGVSPD